MKARLFAAIAASIALVSVLNGCQRVPEPEQEPVAAVVKQCPILLDGVDPGTCWYRPDGTIYAYREEGWHGWILVDE